MRDVISATVIIYSVMPKARYPRIIPKKGKILPTIVRIIPINMTGATINPTNRLLIGAINEICLKYHHIMGAVDSEAASEGLISEINSESNVCLLIRSDCPPHNDSKRCAK